MYERHHEPLLPSRAFLRRVANNVIIGSALVACSLAIGMWGYHYTEGLSWLDSYLNAAMILSGMGPVATLVTNGGKFFAGTYALFSGIIFLVAAAIVFAPVFHRFIHRFHIQEK
jgi:hypothetical protein